MSLFKRLLNPKKHKSDEKAKQSDTSKYYPEEKLPIDEKFTYNFNKNGGKFLYCESMDEVLETFDNILIENDWYEQDVFCVDKNLSSRFDGFNLNFTKNHILFNHLRIFSGKKRLYLTFFKPNKRKKA